ncbi:MAG: DUF2802 domain-containing protein [Pseudomonadota bacterium]
MGLARDGNPALNLHINGNDEMNLNYVELLQQFSPMLMMLVSIIVLLSLVNLKRKIVNQEKQIRNLHQENDAILTCSRGISDKLHFYQQQFKHIVDRQDKLEVGEAETSAYKQAMALFNRGASTEELLTTCDLSRGELNLISHLQKSKKSSRLQ